MLAFKTADLEVQQENSYAYTTAPAHHLKSISASAISFLDYNTLQSLPPAQPMDALYADVGRHDMVLDGLHFKLDTYLHEPLMQHARVSSIQGSESNICVEWCDPLRYWMVCIFFFALMHISQIFIEC
jgi:hypothetical protein